MFNAVPAVLPLTPALLALNMCISQAVNDLLASEETTQAFPGIPYRTGLSWGTVPWPAGLRASPQDQRETLLW